MIQDRYENDSLHLTLCHYNLGHKLMNNHREEGFWYLTMSNRPFGDEIIFTNFQHQTFYDDNDKGKRGHHLQSII